MTTALSFYLAEQQPVRHHPEGGGADDQEGLQGPVQECLGGGQEQEVGEGEAA